MCVHASTHVHMYGCMYGRINEYLHAFYTCACVCVWVWLGLCIDNGMDECLLACMNACTCRGVYECVYAHVRVWVHVSPCGGSTTLRRAKS